MSSDFYKGDILLNKLKDLFFTFGDSASTRADLFWEFNEEGYGNTYTTNHKNKLLKSVEAFISSMAQLETKSIITQYFPSLESSPTNNQPLYSDSLINELFIYLEKLNLIEGFIEKLHLLHNNNKPKNNYDQENIFNKIMQYHNKVLVAQVQIDIPSEFDEYEHESIQPPLEIRSRLFLGKLMLFTDFNFYIVPMDTNFNDPDLSRCFRINDCKYVYVLKNGEIIWPQY